MANLDFLGGYDVSKNIFFFGYELGGYSDNIDHARAKFRIR